MVEDQDGWQRCPKGVADRSDLITRHGDRERRDQAASEIEEGI